MEIVGEKGVVALDSFAEYLTVYSQDSSRNPCWTGYGPDPNRAMLEEFVASIREERDPSVTWKDGYEALRVALAAYRSGDEQQPVTLRE
jgi:UDP-N-acetylglucosamine 3-dehydrogenase